MSHDWKAAIKDLEDLREIELTDDKHLAAAIDAMKEMQRREDKKARIKEIMKS